MDGRTARRIPLGGVECPIVPTWKAAGMRRRGFTLIELLVVIGILIVVAGIAVPMSLRAFRSAEVSRMRMDMQSLATALEAYRQDHGDYPRLMGPYDDSLPDLVPPPNDPAGVAYPNPRKYLRGAILLAQALVAPAPAADDGADGFGFRTRGTVGTVHGPYIKPEAFTIGDNPYTPSEGLTDPTAPLLFGKGGKPILYYAAAPNKPNITQANRFVADFKDASGARPLYNWRDNTPKSYGNVLELQLDFMRHTLGDTDTNGRINGDESARYTGPFILWSAGPDGVYGTEDDITNFNEQ